MTVAGNTPADLGGEPRQWRQGSLVYGVGGLAVLFAWLLLGDFAWSLKERAVVPVAQVLLKQLQASDFFIALVVGSLPAALGMLPNLARLYEKLMQRASFIESKPA